ncbi:plasmid replication protein RepC [Ensifer soli]|uniref:plasmid replication protein RepC n=1 Tax=Ciceribacter sp. sgz301302 TaxID=3342379 RepID=UPI0035B7E2A3
METATVTTPFGRRPMTLALVKRQVETAGRTSGTPVDKWKVFRSVCEAKDMLGLQDRALGVLNALLSFYPETELSEEHGLVVFPSNAQLSLRAHGITGTTLRRHLSALVEAGLIHRRDSLNGKRYARKGRGGEIEQAFGFSIEPLIARAGEFAVLAQEVVDERLRFKRAKEALTLCRRDIRKLISAAIEEGANGDWAAIEAMYVAILTRLPRTPDRLMAEAILDDLTLLREEIVNRLESQTKAENSAGNAIGNGGHIQNSKSESISDLEPRSEEAQGATQAEEPQHQRTQLVAETDAQQRQRPAQSLSRPPIEPIKAFPLALVLKACPEITPYGPGGAIGSWRDLMAAAVVVRSMLGVSPSAYEEACAIMGPEGAATAIACILERGGQINSAGGYLRDLTRRSERGEFSLGPMIMALLRAGQLGAPNFMRQAQINDLTSGTLTRPWLAAARDTLCNR